MGGNSINTNLNHVVYTTFKIISLNFVVSRGFNFASKLPKYKEIISFQIFKTKLDLKTFNIQTNNQNRVSRTNHMECRHEGAMVMSPEPSDLSL